MFCLVFVLIEKTLRKALRKANSAVTSAGPTNSSTAGALVAFEKELKRRKTQKRKEVRLSITHFALAMLMFVLKLCFFFCGKSQAKGNNLNQKIKTLIVGSRALIFTGTIPV